jgi:hypothetical protein
VKPQAEIKDSENLSTLQINLEEEEDGEHQPWFYGAKSGKAFDPSCQPKPQTRS